MSKILVTGGLGYIGSHTVIQLINNGLNNPDYFNEQLSNQIDSIYSMYPKSKYINYLAFIVNKESSDSTKNFDALSLSDSLGGFSIGHSIDISGSSHLIVFSKEAS